MLPIEKPHQLRASKRLQNQRAKQNDNVRSLTEWFKNDDVIQERLKDLRKEIEDKKEAQKRETEKKNLERQETLREREKICHEYNLRKRRCEDEKRERNEEALKKLIENRKRKR